jgi:glycosyltransferase involved in cell wall biosynthesis
MRLPRGLAGPARGVAQGLVRVRTMSWPPVTRLFAVGDGGGWSVDEDAAHVAATARRLGLAVGPTRWARFVEHQAVFHTSQFEAVVPRWLGSSNSLGVAYLHGRPGTPGMPEFDRCFDALRARPGRFAVIQVTHGEMHDLVLSAGVPPDRVFRIPLGIDLERFPFGDAAARAAARTALGLPESAFVVGSFQKDGVGWGEGFEPKLIKGPDTLVAAVERLHALVPELVVLLTGPARGYVRRELEQKGVPYRHVVARSRDELARAYRALDVYLVTSRQEGGPKAVLESLASGVPLVSTRVGQAAEIVVSGSNGLLVDVDDAEAIAAAAAQIQSDGRLAETLRTAGRTTAANFAHERLDRHWSELFARFGFAAERRGG